MARAFHGRVYVNIRCRANTFSFPLAFIVVLRNKGDKNFFIQKYLFEKFYSENGAWGILKERLKKIFLLEKFLLGYGPPYLLTPNQPDILMISGPKGRNGGQF